MSISTDDDFILNALKEKEDYLLSELLCDELIFNGSLASDLEKEIEENDKTIKLAVAKA